MPLIHLFIILLFSGCTKSHDPFAKDILKAKQQIEVNKQEALAAQEEYKNLQIQRSKQ